MITSKSLTQAIALHKETKCDSVVSLSEVNHGHPYWAKNYNPETGKIEILKVTAFQDVGKAIHRAYVEGQIQGGTTQGIGWAINEEYFMLDGQMKNNTFLDYRMPTSLDLPMIDPVVIEVFNPNHPFGVKGVGESNIVPPLGAVSDAVYNAIGKRIYDLPINPEAIIRAINGKL